MIVVLKGSQASGWYGPPKGTHTGGKASGASLVGNVTFSKPGSEFAGFDSLSRQEGLILNGIPLSSVGDRDWSSIPDAVREPKLPEARRIATGVVIAEPDGRIWICEVANHFDGLEHSFSKGHLERGLTPQQNAIKEAYEELGLQVEIQAYLMDYAGSYATSRYYIAKRTGGSPFDAGWETDNVKLVEPSVARNLFNFSRDRQVLDAYLNTER